MECATGIHDNQWFFIRWLIFDGDAPAHRLRQHAATQPRADDGM